MTQHVSFGIELPSSLLDELAGYTWDRQTISHSDAGVFTLTADGRRQADTAPEDR